MPAYIREIEASSFSLSNSARSFGKRYDSTSAAPAEKVEWPDEQIRHHRDHVQPIGDAVVGVPHVGLRRDGADVSVVTLERAFPVVIPCVMAVEAAREQRSSGDHDAVIDGLRARGHGNEQNDRKQRECVDHNPRNVAVNAQLDQ